MNLNFDILPHQNQIGKQKKHRCKEKTTDEKTIRVSAIMASVLLEFMPRIISLMNMFVIDFQNRKREFGLLEAVGITQKQLKAMLNREIGIYLGGSLAISLVCGSIFSIIVFRRLDAINHCITQELPWLFLLALVAVLAVIYLIFTAYAKSELRKTCILSAIRDE